ncbi:response regulator receiver domain-containing protein [Terrimicrobium sacchariphilum]|uniref:Response regulator receiver domain-containing protein n=1 Tax=Terrimicrobium sacchariphilum TaxID=690879 RepID=A0A146G9T6_TERSA|nr:response regulator [Terrimicrobium sacchariphilum]GAT34415.1 response regulator receiver domain-containing protein [Terrimicrobium sacchariphilum]
MDQKGILLVDDEALALKYFSKAFGQRFPIYAASSAAAALQVLDEHAPRIGAVVTDQRMPEATGVELLTVVRNKYPGTARILTTAYSDFDVLVSAINVGAVHSFVAKPWNIGDLERTLVEALEMRNRRLPGRPGLVFPGDEMAHPVTDDRVYDVGLIAARLGHYVHNALCPMTFLLDQLIANKPVNQICSLEFLQEVRNHIHEVSRTLKEFEQISAPLRDCDREVLDLRAVFNRTLAEMVSIREQKQLQIEALIPADLPEIHGSARQIGKLFRFMIAEEAVSLPPDSLLRIVFSKHLRNGECQGVDIEFEDYSAVSASVDPGNFLLPFYVRGGNPREFGVFLAACYFIARHHGGTFEVHRKAEGDGLCFRIFLPINGRRFPLEGTDFLGKSFPEPYNTLSRS